MKIKYYSVVFLSFFLIFSMFFFLHHSIAKELTTEEVKQKKHEIHVDMPKSNHKELMDMIATEINFR